MLLQWSAKKPRPLKSGVGQTKEEGKSMELKRFFELMSEKLKLDFVDLSKLIDHNLTAGEAREEALHQFLIQNLPNRIGISSGFVIDTAGNTSKQIDVIIYDKNYGSFFTIGGANFFPCEIVIAVGEVKSDVASTDKLYDALDKIKSVKILDRHRGGRTELITGPGLSIKGLKYEPLTCYRDQIFGFIFSSKSLKRDNFLKAFKDWRQKEEKRLWPNMACFYDDFFMSYEIQDALAPDPNNAKFIYTTKPGDGSELLLFFLILNNFINIAHVARPSLLDYCDITKSDVDYHDL